MSTSSEKPSEKSSGTSSHSGASHGTSSPEHAQSSPQGDPQGPGSQGRGSQGSQPTAPHSSQAGPTGGEGSGSGEHPANDQKQKEEVKQLLQALGRTLDSQSPIANAQAHKILEQLQEKLGLSEGPGPSESSAPSAPHSKGGAGGHIGQPSS